METRDIVVVGGSAGSVEALTRIVAALPADLPAAVFVAVHTAPHRDTLLAQVLARAGTLAVEAACDGAPAQHGCVYVAPPDRHLLLRPGHVHLSRGPKENFTRPAINPLFRTAALAYGPRVIGVVITGNLDDGTAGLLAIERAGGATVVQDPADAAYPTMPASAARHVNVDHVVPLDEIAPLLVRLVSSAANGRTGAASHDRAESHMTDEAMDWHGDYARPDVAAGLTCPECSGPLWRIGDEPVVEYGCLIGHRFSPETMLSASAVKVEELLGASLRALEERAMLTEQLAARARERGGDARRADRHVREAVAALSGARTLREMLREDPVAVPDAA